MLSGEVHAIVGSSFTLSNGVSTDFHSALTDHRHYGRALTPFTELIRCWTSLSIIGTTSDYFPQLLCLSSLEFVLLLFREQEAFGPIQQERQYQRPKRLDFGSLAQCS